MTIATAKKTLNQARIELHQSRKNDEEGLRQAAEKAWRAAREAVYAVMDVVGSRPGESTLGVSAVAAFEAKNLRRPQGRAQPLRDGYLVGLRLHGACFYDGNCPSKGELEADFDRIETLIEQAEYDTFVLGQGKGRRK